MRQGPTATHESCGAAAVSRPGARLRRMLRVLQSGAADIVLVVAAAVALTAYWQSVAPVYFTADSLGYLEVARGLVGQESGSFPPYRTPGFPLLLVATLAPALDSLTGVLVCQALMAVLLPVLLFLTLRPVGRWVSLTASLLLLASLVPLVYSTWIMTEQLSLFLLFLFIFLFSRYARHSDRSWLLHLATLVAFCAVLTRPNLAIFVPAVVVACLCMRDRRVRTLTFTLAGYSVLMIAWSLADYHWLSHGGRAPKEATTGGAAERRFAEVYFRTWDHQIDNGFGKPLIRPDHGPASRQLYSTLASFLHNHRGNWRGMPPRPLFAPFADRPDALLKRIFSRPTSAYCTFIAGALRGELGSDRDAEQLLEEVAAEYGNGKFGRYRNNLSLRPPNGIGGKMLFLQAYLTAGHHGQAARIAREPRRLNRRADRLVNAANGPATRELRRGLLEYATLFPERWEPMGPPGFFDKHRGDPQGLIDFIFDHPHVVYHWFIWTAADEIYGPAAADKLLRTAAWEAFAAHPGSTVMFWENFLIAVAGPSDVKYDNIRVSGFVSMYDLDCARDDFPQLPERMRSQLPAAKTVDAAAIARRRFGRLLNCVLYLLLRPLSIAASLVFLPFWWNSRHRSLCILILLLFFFQAAAIAVFSQPHVRYSDMFCLLPTVVALVGIQSAVQARREARTGGPPVEACRETAAPTVRCV